MSMINMCLVYEMRPSEALGIENDYISYCLDSAMATLISTIKSSEKMPILRFRDNEKQSGNKMLMELLPQSQ